MYSGLFAAGSNAQGQLANGTFQDSILFTQSLFTDFQHPPPPEVHPTSGEPEPNLAHKLSRPTCLPHASKVVKIATGANHTLILLRPDPSHGHHNNANLVYGSGDNSRGQLGLTALGTAPTALTTFQRLSPTLEKHGYHVVDIAAAWETSFLLLRHRTAPDRKTDVLIAIGANDFGELGAPTPLTSTSANAHQGAPRGGAGEHIVAFDDILQSVPASYQISLISAAVHHVIVILDIASGVNSQKHQIIAGWGACRHGQLGPQSSPAKPSLKASGRLQHSFPKSLSRPTLLAIIHDTAKRVTRVCGGAQHTVLLHASGKVTVWGSNRKNQLEGMSSEGDVVEIGCTWNGTYLVKAATSAQPWSLHATGSGKRGQLGRTSSDVASSSKARKPPVTLSEPNLAPVDFPIMSDSTRRFADAHRVRKLVCGSEHVLTLLDVLDTESGRTEDGPTELWGWGWNEHGNLGVGHREDVHIPSKLAVPPSLGAASLRITDVWAGCGTSWLALEVSEPDGISSPERTKMT